MLPDEGGRVTELVARPLLSLVAPELGGFAQPLAGERPRGAGLLEALPFPVGYGVETAMLIDALRAVRARRAWRRSTWARGQNRHQPLRELGAMALAVMGAGLRRGLPTEVWEGFAAGRMRSPAPGGGTVVRDVPLDERASARRAAPPGGSGRLLGVTALGELLDDLRAERRQVVRVAARDEPVVDGDLLVHPVRRRRSSRSVRSARPGGERAAAHDVGLDERPRAVADHARPACPSSKKPRTKRWTSSAVRRKSGLATPPGSTSPS